MIQESRLSHSDHSVNRNTLLPASIGWIYPVMIVLISAWSLDILSSLSVICNAMSYESPVLLGDAISTFDGIIQTGSVLYSQFRTLKHASDNAVNWRLFRSDNNAIKKVDYSMTFLYDRASIAVVQRPRILLV